MAEQDDTSVIAALAGRVDKTDEKLDKLAEGMASLLRMVQARETAQQAPDVFVRTLPKREIEAGEKAEFHGKSEVITDDNDEPLIISDKRQLDVEWARQHEADKDFDNEILTVHIQKTSDPFADKVFGISVNGMEEVFTRGETKKVRRMHVEGLARSKPTSYRNEEYFAADGERRVRHPSDTGLRYNFSVIHDPRGAVGERWLEHVLAQP